MYRRLNYIVCRRLERVVLPSPAVCFLDLSSRVNGLLFTDPGDQTTMAQCVLTQWK